MIISYNYFNALLNLAYTLIIVQSRSFWISNWRGSNNSYLHY